MFPSRKETGAPRKGKVLEVIGESDEYKVIDVRRQLT